jgi:hypothetical protein
MKVIAQDGKQYEIFEITANGNKLYGQPKKVKDNPVFLGEYDSSKKLYMVMAEAYCQNQLNKISVFRMPANEEVEDTI